ETMIQQTHTFKAHYFYISVIVILALVLLFGGLYSIYVYAYQQKGSYHTNEPKNLESPSNDLLWVLAVSTSESFSTEPVKQKQTKKKIQI
uniref:Neurexin/syndecan/glycophorin C domain-containing protein n=1 Tax=Sphaeramia orbicularis TaxID=375764 RepID=A0A673B9P4_9TELE